MTHPTTPLDQAKALFASEGLPFPPLPEALAQRLQPQGQYLFATQALSASPYTLEHYSMALRDTPIREDFALIGFDGYGMNSWALHYFLVQPGIALFVQLPWGGAYLDADAARSTITDTWQWSQNMQASLARALREGLLPAHWRMLIVLSEFTESGWAWLPSPPPGADQFTWQAAGDVRLAAGNALLELIDGTTQLP